MWKTSCGEDHETQELMSLDEYIAYELEEINKLTGQMTCKDAVVLIDEYSIDDLEKAKTEERFLIYDDDLAAVVKQFCESRA